MKFPAGTFVLIILLAVISSGCGPGPDSTGAAVVVDGQAEIAARPAPVGWLEVVIPGGPPSVFAVDEGGVWAAFDGGGVLKCSVADGRWSSFDLGSAAVYPVAASATAEGLTLLSDSALIAFSGEGEAIVTPLPEGFLPSDLALDDQSSAAILAVDGSIALLSADGWDVRSPEEPVNSAEGLSWLAPDWVFTSGDRLLRYDPSVNLWQIETMPSCGPALVADGAVFITSGEDVVRRDAAGEWSEVLRGRLCGDLAVSGQRVIDPAMPSEVLADALPVDPVNLMRGSSQGAIWALDDMGLLVCAELGALETRISGYDMERIECSLAGQTGSSSGSSAGVTPVLTAASGAFRIYESVSSRPDPFTEFPARRRDLRRPLGELAIEELRLVGITLDPSGGDQAMVEDVNGVPYILYVDTQLANNTRIAEITGNEVIVVQEVTVDYGPEHGGTASIPTIYTMRLHEEGGM